MVVFFVLAMLSTPFAEATQTAYAQQDADRLRALFDRASSRADSLLVRYRLYPLTEDASVLDGLPSSLSDGTAREYALLSGLWAYRAGEASIFSAVTYGRRSTNLLEEAKTQAPNAPFVLLVEGQSLLFRPSIAGKDPDGAARRFGQAAEPAGRALRGIGGHERADVHGRAPCPQPEGRRVGVGPGLLPQSCCSPAGRGSGGDTTFPSV